ncbi:MAG: hypothetical protein SPH68_08210 [Candidatus Borkfalkiaceae bacterium]|nr:hypothetical protein [Clostridiales bacterium]MDD6995430.1 hypothetical protein [Clostridia bacterium]MDY6224122.1 hypothetical protein [Christensenellaceae bacterium]
MEKYAFISDLNDYFCEKYANYDKICILKGYVMPKMQTTERRPDGTDYSYTLPPETMRLSLQKNKAELLSELKERITDYTFSFSFRPLSFFEKLRNNRSKYSFRKTFSAVCARYSLTAEEALSRTDIGDKTKKRLLGGAYYPTKNLLFTLALVCGFSMQDTEALLTVCGLSFDYALVKDVTVSYLIVNRVHNEEMARAALEEFKVDGLFFRGGGL